PGTSLQQSLATGDRMTDDLLKHAAIVSVAQQCGRAELGEDTWGVDYSELEVDFKRLAAGEQEGALRHVKTVLKNVAGFSFDVMPFLTERIKETISGTYGSVAVKVYGDDLGAIDRAAQSIAIALNAVSGRESVRVEPQTGIPELVVRVRSEDLARY